MKLVIKSPNNHLLVRMQGSAWTALMGFNE